VSATARIPLQEKPAEGQESGSREAPMLWESADAEPGVLFHFAAALATSEGPLARKYLALCWPARWLHSSFPPATNQSPG